MNDLSKKISTLSAVPGVCAIALGGSRSRNEAGPESDYDIGIYYSGNNLDLEVLGNSMKSLDDEHRGNLLNPPAMLKLRPKLRKMKWILK